MGFDMEREMSVSHGDRAGERYDALVLCISALQLSMPAPEQVEFLTDAIDACERIATLFDRMRLPADRWGGP
jgi:hypothetical protein